MTPGERMIWAAAFVEAFNRRMNNATDLDAYGHPTLSSSQRIVRVPSMAAIDAASMVRIAREALPNLTTTVPKPGHEQRVSEAIEMLRDMLGVNHDGSPYR